MGGRRRLLTEAFVLAAPSEVAAYLVQDWALMLRALGATLGNAAAGFAIGNLAAVALAGIALIWPRAERVVTGLALLVFCLPLVATGPILRVFFGPGAGPQIALAALAVYYTTLIPLLVGLRAAPDSWFDLVRSYGRGRLAALVHVRAMAALPYLFAGLQIAAPAAFLGAMVGEFTGAERGMGVLTIRAIRALDVEMTWALATVATAVSILAYLAIGSLARRILLEAPPVILAAPPAAGGHRSGGMGRRRWHAGAGRCAWAMGGCDPGVRPQPVLRQGAGRRLRTRSCTCARCGRHARRHRRSAGRDRGVPAARLSRRACGGGGACGAACPCSGCRGHAMPLAIALRSVPIVTTAPLVVLLLGRGATGTITLVAVMVFFPTFVACLQGLRQAPGQVMAVLDSYAAGPLTRLVRVRIPAMLPAFFASARMAVPASILAVTVVEWLATGSGIGSLMALSASLSDYDMLWSAVVLVAALSALGYGAVGWAERRVLARYAPEQMA
jgi:sulfonate transport system permease protein